MNSALSSFAGALGAALPTPPGVPFPPSGGVGGGDFFGGGAGGPMVMGGGLPPNMAFDQQLFERAAAAQMGSDPLTRTMGRGRRGQPGQRTVSSFFAAEQLRADLATRAAQSTLVLDPDDPRTSFTPDRVHEFHTLFPLDSNVEDMTVGCLSCASRVFKAVSEVDGGTYALRKLESVRIQQDHNQMRKQWVEIAHPNVVRLRDIFITNEFNGQNNALTFVHDFVFGAMTFEERHMRGDNMGGINEEVIWSYMAQLTSAIRYMHARGKAVRCLNASKVLVTPQQRVYINCCGILDVIGDKKVHGEVLMTEDLRELGTLLLQTVCRSMEASQPTQLAASIDYLAAHYHFDLKDFVVYCITQPGGNASIFTACARIAGRLAEQVDSAYQHIDACHRELAKEIQCGRLFRLLAKLNTILERPDGRGSEANSWAETGDRCLRAYSRSATAIFTRIRTLSAMGGVQRLELFPGAIAIVM